MNEQTAFATPLSKSSIGVMSVLDNAEQQLVANCSHSYSKLSLTFL